MYAFRQSRIICGAAALAVCALILAQPQAAAAGFAAGLRLCAYSLLPALFPFFVLCGIVVASGAHTVFGRVLCPITKLCGLDGSDAPGLLMLSWLGGYAVCAAALRQSLASGRISGRQAIKLLILGCCSSPGFVIGCVGGQLLGSVRLGATLYFCQLAANFLAAACCFPLFARLHLYPGATCPAAQTGNASARAIGSAVDSSLAVCGCVLFFHVVSATAKGMVPLPPLASAALDGLLEITTGCAAFAGIGGTAGLYGTAACLSLLSCSVFMQLGTLLPLGRGLALLGFSRLIHLAFFVAEIRLCALLMPDMAARSVYSTLAPRIVPMSRLAPDAAVCVLLFLCALLYNCCQKIYNKSKAIPGKSK